MVTNVFVTWLGVASYVLHGTLGGSSIYYVQPSPLKLLILDPAESPEHPVLRQRRVTSSKRFISYFRCFGWGPNCGIADGSKTSKQGGGPPTLVNQTPLLDNKTSKSVNSGDGSGPMWAKVPTKFEPFFSLTSGITRNFHSTIRFNTTSYLILSDLMH